MKIYLTESVNSLHFPNYVRYILNKAAGKNLILIK